MGQDIQQVCTKCGRQVTGALKTYRNGENFCGKCGGETISKCSNCGTDILGDFVNDLEGRSFKPPRNCTKCGEPFPWADKIDAGKAPGLDYYKERGVPGSKKSFPTWPSLFGIVGVCLLCLIFYDLGSGEKITIGVSLSFLGAFVLCFLSVILRKEKP